MVTTRVTLAPEAMVPSEQLTTPNPVAPQPAGNTAVPRGNWLFHNTLRNASAAASGPRLVIVQVWVTGAPVNAGSGVAVTVRRKSALGGRTVVEVVALLLAATGSVDVVETVPVVEYVPGLG